MKVTRKSQISGIEHTLELPITAEQLADYEAGTLVQKAFPDLEPPLREFIMSGITPEEWQRTFGEGPPDETQP